MNKIVIVEYDAGVIDPGMKGSRLPDLHSTSQIGTMLHMRNNDVMNVIDLVMSRRLNYGRYRTRYELDDLVYMLTTQQMEDFVNYIEPSFGKDIIAQIKQNGQLLSRLDCRKVIARCPKKLIDTEGLDSVCGGALPPKVECILI